jgi:hypothetical protein
MLKKKKKVEEGINYFKIYIPRSDVKFSVNLGNTNKNS